eukprot:2252178-Pleurochrysis_carterae.AAC.1
MVVMPSPLRAALERRFSSLSAARGYGVSAHWAGAQGITGHQRSGAPRSNNLVDRTTVIEKLVRSQLADDLKSCQSWARVNSSCSSVPAVPAQHSRLACRVRLKELGQIRVLNLFAQELAENLGVERTGPDIEQIRRLRRS